MSRFSITSPYLTRLVDIDGRYWQFAYWGTGYVYIREVVEDVNDVAVPLGGSRDQWPYLVDLNDWKRTPDTVSRTWLDSKSAEWITDRNADLAADNITD